MRGAAAARTAQRPWDRDPREGEEQPGSAARGQCCLCCCAFRAGAPAGIGLYIEEVVLFEGMGPAGGAEAAASWRFLMVPKGRIIVTSAPQRRETRCPVLISGVLHL